jgi:hypothetical protein
MIGQNIAPMYAGGALGITGRIINRTSHLVSSEDGSNPEQFADPSSVNYGLDISVEGGAKNYGLSSNAPLIAPSFIGTKVSELVFEETGDYHINFAQSNIFLIYTDIYRDIILPTETQVKGMFINTINKNEDFGFVVIFKMRAGSQQVVLRDIYNENETLSDYPMSPGDSVMLLVTTIGGFKYSILNYYK